MGRNRFLVENQPVESVAVLFKHSTLGDVLMAEGLAWGWGAFKDCDNPPAPSRLRTCDTRYKGMACRNPILWALSRLLTRRFFGMRFKKGVQKGVRHRCGQHPSGRSGSGA